MSDSTRPASVVRSVLFVCKYNQIRSQLAEALAKQIIGQSIYVQSAGIKEGSGIDPFAAAVLREVGIERGGHPSRTIADLRDVEGMNFDLIVTLSPEAQHVVLDLMRSSPAMVEYWPTFDPTAVQGNYEREMDAYRQVRDALSQQIRQRLAPTPSPLWSGDMET